VRPDDGPAVDPVMVQCLGLDQSFSGPATVVARYVGVVCLAFDCLEGAEEEGGAEGVFEQTDGEAGEDAAETDVAQLVVLCFPSSMSEVRKRTCSASKGAARSDCTPPAIRPAVNVVDGGGGGYVRFV
jgi:hypothetical protein